MQDMCEMLKALEGMHLESTSQAGSVDELDRCMRSLQLAKNNSGMAQQNKISSAELRIRNSMTGNMLSKLEYESEEHMLRQSLSKIVETLEAQFAYRNTRATLVTLGGERLRATDSHGDRVYLMDVVKQCSSRVEEPSLAVTGDHEDFLHAPKDTKVIFELGCIVQHDYEDVEEQHALEGLSALDSAQDVVTAIQCPSRDVGQMLSLVSSTMQKQLGWQQAPLRI